MLGVPGALRKLGLIFLGPVISFLLATQVGSAIRSEEMAACWPSEFLEKEEKAYKAWIAIKYKDSYLKIRAFCFNDTSENQVLRYKLEAKKSGKSGTANIFQAGSVHIPSQEKKCLSKVTLGISPKDCYQMKLEVYKDGKLVAEDSVCYPYELSLFSPAKTTQTCEAKTEFIFCRLLCKTKTLTTLSFPGFFLFRKFTPV